MGNTAELDLSLCKHSHLTPLGHVLCPPMCEGKECARPHLDAANEDLWMKEHEDLAKRAEEVVNKMLGLPTHGSGSEKATLSKDDLADFSSESKEKKVTFREDRGIDAYCKSKKLISPSKTENRVRKKV